MLADGERQRADSPQDEDERDQRRHRAEQSRAEAHGIFAELPQVLGDALVGVVDGALQLDAVVAAAVQPMRQVTSSVSQRRQRSRR